MRLLGILLGRSKVVYFALAILTLINGLLNVLLLTVITNTLVGQSSFSSHLARYEWVIFSGIVVIAFITSKLSQSYMIKLTTESGYELEIDIIQKLRFASLQDFEKIGHENVFSVLADVRNLANLPEIIMTGMNSILVMACCIVLLFTKSFFGGTLVILMMGFLLIVYIVRNGHIEKKLTKLRDLQSVYFRYLNDLLYGFKEVKMSFVRNENMYNDFVKKNREEGKRIGIETGIDYMYNELTGRFSWYIVIGLIIFGLPYILELDKAGISSFLVIVLYLMGPVAVFVTLVPRYTRMKVALVRLKEFNEVLDKKVSERSSEMRRSNGSDFANLRFDQVTYQYRGNNENITFNFGPIDLEIKAGQVIFITGGNGSGKSTLVNLLSGLYGPADGRIFLNGNKIDKEDYDGYNDLAAAIFTSNHLFSENYDKFDLTENNLEFADYLKRMKMDGIIHYDLKKNFVNTRISKGQQKRLALIFALLEKRPILILDEWAAEQDPEYRAFFYEEWLPLFKRQGKTIIAITHDDRYFSCADRIVKLEFGKIINDN